MKRWQVPNVLYSRPSDFLGGSKLASSSWISASGAPGSLKRGVREARGRCQASHHHLLA